MRRTKHSKYKRYVTVDLSRSDLTKNDSDKPSYITRIQAFTSALG